MDNFFDIIIIGAGHAGIEAAWASANYNLNIALVTLPDVDIGSTPCNPAVGGVGKGQVVREIDALGGIMGIIADKAAIQFRTLNDSKGYAVHSTRSQVDKDVYAQTAESIVSKKDNIKIIRDKVDRVIKSDKFFKIALSSKQEILSHKVVVTAGTFLSGKLHIGPEQIIGGRVDCQSSAGMDSIFKGVSSLKTKFKTGTPARLAGSTIDFSKMIPQESDLNVMNFHCLHEPRERFLKQSTCYLTRTNSSTLKIIRENKEKSPIYNGQIAGVGPRYCPSIEDKAFRYPDRDSHHIFVEPEGLSVDTYYPNGMSTSLPKSIQLDFIRTIEGLEQADIAIYGYAVEYDVVDTSKLSITLEYQDIEGLYFAGQMNGTSGYEEAAGQGLIAGYNAALSLLKKSPLVLSRKDSYIGVMIEDLVSNLRDEPYRLFTARSENRLAIREDNTVNRMYKYRKSLNLNHALDQYQEKYMSEFNLLLELCNKIKFQNSSGHNIEKFKTQGYGDLKPMLTVADLVKRSKLNPVNTLLYELKDYGVDFEERVVKGVAVALKYEGYMIRAESENKKLNKLDSLKIDWEKLCSSSNLSNECKQRIEIIKPASFSQLKRIDGIRPATLAYVAGNLI